MSQGRPEERLPFQRVTATLAAPYGGVGRRRGRAIYSLLVRPLNRERRNPKPEDSLGRKPIQVDVLARTRTCGRAGSTVARGQASPIRCAVAARVSALTKPPTGHRAEGDQEVLLFILQIAVGAAAWFLIASLFAHRLLGEIWVFRFVGRDVPVRTTDLGGKYSRVAVLGGCRHGHGGGGRPATSIAVKSRPVTSGRGRNGAHARQPSRPPALGVIAPLSDTSGPAAHVPPHIPVRSQKCSYL